jgi:hypothetical protein
MHESPLHLALRKLLDSKAADNALGAGAQSLAAKYFTG